MRKKLPIGRVVRTILGKLYVGLEDPDFNLSLRTAPAECDGVKLLSLVPQHHSAPDPPRGF